MRSLRFMLRQWISLEAVTIFLLRHYYALRLCWVIVTLSVPSSNHELWPCKLQPQLPLLLQRVTIYCSFGSQDDRQIRIQKFMGHFGKIKRNMTKINRLWTLPCGNLSRGNKHLQIPKIKTRLLAWSRLICLTLCYLNYQMRYEIHHQRHQTHEKMGLWENTIGKLWHRRKGKWLTSRFKDDTSTSTPLGRHNCSK